MHLLYMTAHSIMTGTCCSHLSIQKQPNQTVFTCSSGLLSTTDYAIPYAFHKLHAHTDLPTLNRWQYQQHNNTQHNYSTGIVPFQLQLTRQESVFAPTRPVSISPPNCSYKWLQSDKEPQVHTIHVEKNIHSVCKQLHTCMCAYKHTHTQHALT